MVRLLICRHARKYFSNPDETQMVDIQRAMGLLAFPVHTQIAPYKVRIVGSYTYKFQKNLNDCVPHLYTLVHAGL